MIQLFQYTQDAAGMISGNTIAGILGGISLVLGAIGIPKIYENWRNIREMKYKEIMDQLATTQTELNDVKRELNLTKDQLQKMSTIITIVMPMLKLKNQNDPETMELIKIFERESGMKKAKE